MATSCLSVSELVTNVARHAAVISPTVKVELSTDDTELTVSVADAHPFRPKALPAPNGSGGWGLALAKGLVEEAHGRHEVVDDASTGGKAVVLHLPLASGRRLKPGPHHRTTAPPDAAGLAASCPHTTA
ncbi:ATP-binding protein [Kitasatospora sp. NPDC088351]|uniref:ATP-binding protein n=1 Tax=Kitasatospora sp. NPDC088351 TaxID=3155180 RepID=UPI0034438293